TVPITSGTLMSLEIPGNERCHISGMERDYAMHLEHVRPGSILRIQKENFADVAKRACSLRGVRSFVRVEQGRRSQVHRFQPNKFQRLRSSTGRKFHRGPVPAAPRDHQPWSAAL